MMRIGLVSTSYPDQADGAEAAGAFVADFAAALADRAEVHVIAPGRVAHTQSDEHLLVHRFACRKLPLSLLNPVNPAHWPAIVMTLQGGWRALEQVQLRSPLDHVFALWALPSGAWAQRLKRGYGVPYSTWALGSDIWTLGRLPVIRSYLGHVMRGATARFADGEQLRLDVERIGKRPCEFLPSTRKLPVSRSRNAATSPPYRLAFLGRWHPNKGIDLLLDALQLLAQQDWQRIESIKIFGGGPLGALVRKCVASLQAKGYPVIVGGYLDRQEASSLLEWCDYLLLPSRIESVPVIYSDALQAGRPIVAMPVGDLPSLITSQRTGILAGGRGAEHFATAIRQALGDSPIGFLEALSTATAFFDLGNSVERFLAAVTPTPTSPAASPKPR